jgi:aspartate aminotransferase-like enzyme
VKKHYMFTPGPTMVPQEVLMAEAAPMIHHRTPQFSRLLRETTEWMKELFGTGQEVFTICGSGTAAMEAAIANTCSPGDAVVCVVGGKFGERWVELCEAYGCGVKAVENEWGSSPRVDQVRAALDETPQARVLCVTHSETSTGALADVEALAALTRERDTLLLVDGITSVGVHPVRMDEWGVDVLVSGSQKGLMMPPGLAFIAASPRAWQVIESCTSPRYYLDMRAMQKSLQKDTTPYTAPVSLVRALHEALRMIREEGLENLYARHERLAQAARAAAGALGLKLVAENPVNGVTAVRAPEGIDTNKMTKLTRDTYGVTIAGGQGHLKGKIFRIGHMGYVAPEDLLVAISAVERALMELGHKFEFGAGVAAAHKALFG